MFTLNLLLELRSLEFFFTSMVFAFPWVCPEIISFFKLLKEIHLTVGKDNNYNACNRRSPYCQCTYLLLTEYRVRAVL